jgi:hypothetical protein
MIFLLHRAQTSARQYRVTGMIMKHLRISHCRFALGNITDDDDDDDDDDEALTRRNKYPFAVVRTLPGVHRLRIPPFLCFWFDDT